LKETVICPPREDLSVFVSAVPGANTQPATLNQKLRDGTDIMVQAGSIESFSEMSCACLPLTAYYHIDAAPKPQAAFEQGDALDSMRASFISGISV
jgi:hypothetical protein